ncbi:MAG: calcium/sodium antiporter, partial [Cyanobacteria bacterium P01_F01_bin.53]
KANDPIEAAYAEEIPADLTMANAILKLALGLVTLLIGSDLLVRGASEIALAFGVSELVIGITLVAIGTSLPEGGGFRGWHDLGKRLEGGSYHQIYSLLAKPIYTDGLFSDFCTRSFLRMNQ